MPQLYEVSCFFLLMTSVLCAVGLLSRSFRENIIMTLGMAILMIGTGSRVEDVWQRGHVPFDWFLVHAGLGLFAMGLALQEAHRAYPKPFDWLNSRLNSITALHPEAQPVRLHDPDR